MTLQKIKSANREQLAAGFSLLESMIAMAVLLGVGAIVMYGTLRTMNTQGTITNRTEMHTSVRSATELLQQEIGQAGRIAAPLNAAGTGPQTMTMLTPVVIPPATTTGTVTLNNVLLSPDWAVPSLFNGEWITVDAGANVANGPLQESVQITCGTPCANPVTATFSQNHAGNVPVSVQGSFQWGIIPNTQAGGSDANHLKMFGDINGDGNMVYVTYTCQQGTTAAPGFLYRNEVAWNAAAVPNNDTTMILLNNVLNNPNDQNGNPFPCFLYQIKHVGATAGATGDFVTNVEVTLTVQTELQDPSSHIFQRETKALLNVSPRNVFNAWELYSGNLTNRVQPTPPTVVALYPTNP
jgi:type II secretory pathway pseudopilin PulG